MISSASTLFIASLVFNAASVLGAPIRIPDAGSQVTARTDIPVQPARPAIVDLQSGHRKRSRVVAIPRARFVAERDVTPVTEAIETRQPLDIAVPAVEKRDEEPTIQRRYPRRSRKARS
ncbi:hypothetical protein NLJ89_g9263 [Agrocybe chaxingu]|uniref:Uncharacterized protein n=1 Tax=Agrocybe chaxingu TaxID=84603 RepID=A0A9W8MRZ9_9AGAR|nr:hypothetical protein NLJ89_g9263 [Agrocybe chaxingu]